MPSNTSSRLEKSGTNKEANVFVAGSLVFKHPCGDMRLHPLEGLVLLTYSELAKRITTICRLGEAARNCTRSEVRSASEENKFVSMDRLDDTRVTT